LSKQDEPPVTRTPRSEERGRRPAFGIGAFCRFPTAGGRKEGIVMDVGDGGTYTVKVCKSNFEARSQSYDRTPALCKFTTQLHNSIAPFKKIFFPIKNTASADCVF
jgi:hypothetical protein